MLKYSPPNPWGRVYILLGSCGGVLGGWGSRRSPTPSRSSSPLRLLRPAQIVILKSTKGGEGHTPKSDKCLQAQLRHKRKHTPGRCLPKRAKHQKTGAASH
ncbi:hypothetical protein Taro_015058 [Colocasia esculenta]|uniref:Uncharacterized protein n=1 Tax=Colocasia esculenta TaxID=4460 RepID=A0A843UNS1_COLES|nr:hypothetical protein [Colocasia esculenta]